MDEGAVPDCLNSCITQRRLGGVRRASSSFVFVASNFHFAINNAIWRNSAEGPPIDGVEAAAATMADVGAVFGGCGLSPDGAVALEELRVFTTPTGFGSVAALAAPPPKAAGVADGLW